MPADSAFVVIILLAAGFGAAYFPALTRISRGLVSPYAKADVRRRLAAATVDGLLSSTCLIFYSILDAPVLLLVAAGYLLLRDGVVTGGQSIGKFLFSLVVISLESGRPSTRTASARRNFIFVVPGLNIVAVVLEALTIVKDPQGQRLGDRMAQTQVVEGFGARELIKSVQKELLQSRLVSQPAGPVEAPSPLGQHAPSTESSQYDLVTR
jgi:uncharacterized RDD family membrane protein YckC